MIQRSLVSLSPLLLTLSLVAPASAFVSTVVVPAGASTAAGGIAIDEDGRIWSADFGGNRLYRVELDGSVTVVATGFNTPSGNAFGPDGKLYQSNYQDNVNPGANETIDVINKRDRVSTFATGLAGPVGIAPRADGTFFVVQCDANNVVQISPEGVVSVFATDPQFACPNGIAFDDQGMLYVVNFNNGSIQKISPDGTVSQFATNPGGGSGHIVYVSGGLYMTDRLGHQIHRFDVRNGNLTKSFGSGANSASDGADEQAGFSAPNGIARNREGSVLFTNGAGNAIRRIELDLEKPKRPKRFRAKVEGSSEVELTWKHRSRNKEGFLIEVRGPDGDFEEAGSVDSAATSAVVTDLDAGTSYTFRVTAFNGTSASRASKRKTVTTDP